MHIFEHLPINDLVKIAEMSPRCTDIILHHFIVGKYRCHEKLITVQMSDTDIRLGYKTIFDEFVYITKNVNQTFWVVERFGHIFNHLLYEVVRLGTPDSLKVFELVDKYAVKAAKEIEIYGIDKTAMSKWTYSFDSNVTQIKLGSFLSGPISLNALFPHMKHLTAGHLMESIVQHFPHLTGFVMESDFQDDFDPEMHEFIRLNPQLREFHTSIRKNETYVSYLNEMLPNLESLAMDIFVEDNQPVEGGENIHFGNVKSFALRLVSMVPVQSFRQSVCNLTFEHLESYKIQGDMNFDATDLIEMISVNRNLKFVEAYNVYITIEELEGLVQRLPELKEISIECSIYALLGGFFMGNHVLDRINLNDCSDSVNIGTLEEISSSGWLVFESEKVSNHFSFIRKH